MHRLTPYSKKPIHMSEVSTPWLKVHEAAAHARVSADTIYNACHTGHGSILTTERYDNQRDEALAEAVKCLSTPQTDCQESGRRGDGKAIKAFDAFDRKALEEVNEVSGVGDGFRTRDFRIHNPALYP